MSLTPEQKTKYQTDLKNYIINKRNSSAYFPIKQRIVARTPKLVTTEDMYGALMTIPVDELKYFMKVPDIIEVVNATISSDGKLIKSKINFQSYSHCYDKDYKGASSEEASQLVLATLAYMDQQPDSFRKDWLEHLTKDWKAFLGGNWQKNVHAKAVMQFVGNKDYNMIDFDMSSIEIKDAILHWIYLLLQEVL